MPDAPAEILLLRKMHPLVEAAFEGRHTVHRLAGAADPEALLAAKALAASADRPSSVRFVRSDNGVALDGTRVTSVEVSYRVAGAAVDQTILTAQAPDARHDYLLQEPFFRLGVSGASGRQVTVNGIAVPAGPPFRRGGPKGQQGRQGR